MTKLGFTMTSLVAAIPGAFLCYFLVMVFLDKSGEMTTMLLVLAGATLFFALLVTLMPVGIFVFFKAAPPEEKGSLRDQLESSASVVEADGVSIDGEVEPFDDEGSSFDDESAEFEAFESDDSAEFDAFESDDEVAEIDSEFDSEESGEFSFGDDDDNDDDSFFDDE